ncbi:MAG: YcxB family protein [Bacteroidetes bacterium]|nr:YcxB family protein [Bacteroidota bacterium]MCB0844263.1 YcxB family protein [Bacteroidota bacterium]
MKFTFEQTIDDILDLAKDSYKKNHIIKILWGIFLAAFSFSIFSDMYANGFQVSKVVGYIIIFGILSLFWMAFYRFLRRRIITMMHKKQRTTGPREIEISNEEIKLWTPDSATTFKWSAVTDLRQSDHNYFLYLGKAQAIILPMRVFENEIEEREFLDLVESKIS